MDDTGFVRGFQCLGDLLGDWKGFINGNRTLSDPILQRWPFHQLQHQRSGVVGFFNAVDLRDVRMVQAGENLCLSLKPRETIRVRVSRQTPPADRMKRLTSPRNVVASPLHNSS